MLKYIFLFFLLVYSCGKKSDSNDDGVGSLDEINASFFDKIIPPNSTQSEVTQRIRNMDLSVASDPENTASSSCMQKKVKLTFKEGRNYSQEDPIDITDCFSQSTFSGLENFSVRLKIKAWIQYTIEGVDQNFDGKTLFELPSPILEKKVWVKQSHYISKTVFRGTIVGTGKGFKLESFHLNQDGDSTPCVRGLLSEGKFYANACKDYFYTNTHTEGGQITEELEILEKKTQLVLSSGASYWDENSVVYLSINNWSGTVTHRGGNLAPIVSLKAGTEKIEGIQNTL